MPESPSDLKTSPASRSRGWWGAVERGIRRLSGVVNAVGCSSLVFMMFLLTADVTLRYTANRPITGSLELTEFMMATVVFLGLAYAQAQRAHVRVDFIVTRLPRRLEAAVDSTTILLSIILYAFIAWKSYESAVQLMHKGVVSDRLSIPIFPFYMLVPIGAGLLCLELLLSIKDRLAALFRRKGT